MFNATPELIQEFEAAGLTLIPEDATDSKTRFPCITYLEQGNSDYAIGNTIGYSDISYLIQIWAQNEKTLTALCADVDKIMKSLLFRRTSMNYQHINGLYRKILTYERVIKEHF